MQRTNATNKSAEQNSQWVKIEDINSEDLRYLDYRNKFATISRIEILNRSSGEREVRCDAGRTHRIYCTNLPSHHEFMTDAQLADAVNTLLENNECLKVLKNVILDTLNLQNIVIEPSPPVNKASFVVTRNTTVGDILLDAGSLDFSDLSSSGLSSSPTTLFAVSESGSALQVVHPLPHDFS